MAKSSKGSQWERDVCKILTKWITGQEKPYIFWRGHGSGAMFTNNSKVGEAFSGDIYAVRDEGKWLTSTLSIECKNGYESASIDLFLKENKNDTLEKFWEQTTRDANKSNKVPFLIFKKKNMSTIWLCLPKQIYVPNDMRQIVLKWINLEDMVIVSFKDYLNKISYEEFKKHLEKKGLLI